MKQIKILIIFFIIIALTGCTTKENKEEQAKAKYQKYVKNLDKVNKSSDNLPFNIDVKFDKLNKNEVRYQVVIDKATEDLINIEAIAIHNKQTDDIFPSIGIFDDKQTLKRKKSPSGIILVGYIPYKGQIENFKCDIKVLVKYTSKEKSNVVYYVTNYSN